jgi:hypothetical protein
VNTKEAIDRLADALTGADDDLQQAIAVLREANAKKPLVIVVRDPDYDNEYATFGGEVETYDIDCGRSDLDAEDEATMWAGSHLIAAMELRDEGRIDAAEYIEEAVSNHVDEDIFKEAREEAKADYEQMKTNNTDDKE